MLCKILNAFFIIPAKKNLNQCVAYLGNNRCGAFNTGVLANAYKSGWSLRDRRIDQSSVPNYSIHFHLDSE